MEKLYKLTNSKVSRIFTRKLNFTNFTKISREIKIKPKTLDRKRRKKKRKDPQVKSEKTSDERDDK